jgi:hypothetical protein
MPPKGRKFTKEKNPSGCGCGCERYLRRKKPLKGGGISSLG